ncbi:fibrinogen-like protein 1 [Cochliomyia hominivorax]
MYIKYLIIIIFAIIGANCAMTEIEEMYLNFFIQIESVKKSVEILKLRMDALSDRNPTNNCCSIDKKFSSMIFQNFESIKESINAFNPRVENTLDEDNSKYLDVENRLKNIEVNYAKDLSEMKENYSTLFDELEATKHSEESLRQKNIDLEIKYLNILKEHENVKKTNEDLKLKVNLLTDRVSEMTAKEEAIYNFEQKQIFDIRIDKLPELKRNCKEDLKPADCQAATKCTRKSGYYKIFLPTEIMVFCDTETSGGDWLHILRRQDGSVNFTRSWSDYVKGFGNVEGEYWIGLESLHILTNTNGRQELYVYIENYEGDSRYALYDNFNVSNSSELFKLKSLGNYKGTAGDSMSYNLGSKFATIDMDNNNCANTYKCGWWFERCTRALPTGPYLGTEISKVGVEWQDFGGPLYTHKIMYLMIRKYKS